MDETTLDSEAVVEGLVLALLRGEQVWERLWNAIRPRLVPIVMAPRSAGRSIYTIEDCSNIVDEVKGRLRVGDDERLRMYAEAKRSSPQLKFMSWLRIVAIRATNDFLSGHPNYKRRVGSETASGVGAAATLPSGSRVQGAHASRSHRGTTERLLRLAEKDIPELQRRALEMWAQSDSYDVIGKVLDLADASDAERMVRAAIERVRRRFQIIDGNNAEP